MVPTGSVSSDGNTKSSTKSSEKKRDSGRYRWCFTWNNYDNVPGFQENLKIICKKFVYQKEIGENGTPHLQGAIWLYKKRRLCELQKINKCVHWEHMRNEEASIKYCTKSATAIGAPITYGFPVDIETIQELRCWQDELVDILSYKPDSRTIYWIYDKVGCAGKSEFVKWYAMKHIDNAICANAGNGKDIANLLKTWAEKNDIGAFRVFLYNMARDSAISYKMLETVKDGMMTNTKYECGTLFFNRPHVVVMSNELPNEDSLSTDRWTIYTINNKYELELYESE